MAILSLSRKGQAILYAIISAIVPLMLRIEVQLTEAQARALRAQARLEERSMADLVRESVSGHLARRHVVDRSELARRALALAGRYRSGCRDLAEDHDAHLDEAIGS